MKWLCLILLSCCVFAATAAVDSDAEFQTSYSVKRAGSTLDVDINEAFDAAGTTALRQWLQHIGTALEGVYGHWPRSHWRVSVSPTSASSADPIPWAQVHRGPVDRVEFHTTATPDARALIENWTGYHELAHLLIPYSGKGSRWFSEGLASYYQNLLQARSGVITEAAMWQKLHEGFIRGQEQSQFSEQTLSQLSSTLSENRAFMRVYWSGAWYFLVADTRLRQQSGGKLGLDQALLALNECCADQQLSAQQIVAKLDALNRVVVFQPLYRQLQNSRAIPDHRALYRSLGIIFVDGKLTLQPLGPGAKLRSGIATGSAL
jgi:hypothetical protein